MGGSQDQELRRIRKSFLRAEGFTVELNAPWIAEPQLRYQLELELVSGMSESINPGIRRLFMRQREQGDTIAILGPTTRRWNSLA